MAIPRTNLDDKTFDTLVEEALRIIPGHAPDWTNHNRQDPGITLVELFAWLTEMQQYYLNQIGEANYRKYLKLLGDRPAEATLAKTDVTFSLNSEVLRDVVVPKGTKLLGKGENVVFETEESLLLTSASLEQVLSSSAAGLRDNTDVNIPRRQPPFFAFGEEAETGSILYLGFGKRTFFTWHDLPGAYSDRVRELLDLKYGLAWAKTARIRSWGDRKIRIARGDHTADLKLEGSGAEFRVELTVDDEQEPLDTFFADEDSLQVFLQPFSGGRLISLSFTVFDDYPIPRGRHGNETDVAFPSASVGWEYANRAGKWSPLNIDADSTRRLAQSGRLYFTAPKDMWPRLISPSSKQLYWLRATVLETGYELPPQIDTILLNTVGAIQRDSISEKVDLTSDGRRNQSFDVSSYLALKGINLVQVNEGNGCWQDWRREVDFSGSSADSRHYTLVEDRLTGKVTMKFGDGVQGKIPPIGKNTIRLISYAAEFEAQRLLGRSNGLPNQVFKLDLTSVVSDSLLVQVHTKAHQARQYCDAAGKAPLEKAMVEGECWCDWQRVDDFDSSGPNDRHYVFDGVTSEFQFGDGESGDIPPTPADDTPNIRIIACQIGCGAKGNVQPGAINRLRDPITDLEPAQLVNRRKLMILRLP